MRVTLQPSPTGTVKPKLRGGRVNKLLLLSSLIAVIFLPLWLSKSPDARNGLRATLIATVVFNVLWAAVVLGWFLYQLNDPQQILPLLTVDNPP
jgi:hypothetical protein